ncbi:DnaJ protein -like protein 1 [Capsicum baccatum]|uniref:DnaJ protein-like protein 1 n=1 Tax=Capsicum baccatum TaxID=33114 RepID=A0A2G2V8C4_CAPBA|nr:DnaJ protein -like protein 1 [Capsicum baccatum]
MKHPYNECKGIGKTFSDQNRCLQCEGEKVIQEKKVLEVHMEKGMQNGQRVTFPSEANKVPKTITGDTVFVLQQKEHPKFKRKGDDHFVEHKLILAEDLYGFKFVLTHLDNRQLLIKSQPGKVVKPDQFKAINDKGKLMYQRPFMRVIWGRLLKGLVIFLCKLTLRAEFYCSTIMVFPYKSDIPRAVWNPPLTQRLQQLRKLLSLPMKVYPLAMGPDVHGTKRTGSIVNGVRVDVESITIDGNIIELEAQTEYKVEVDYNREDFDQENDTMVEYKDVAKLVQSVRVRQRAKRIYRYCGFYFSFQDIAYHDFFCKKPLPLSIFDTHYLHNMVGDTEFRKGKGMQLDQLIQHGSSLKETNLHIQPFDLDAIREAFRLRETTPIDVFLVFHSLKKGIPIVPGKSKSESKDKEKKHEKHKDKDKENEKEHKKHKHIHKDQSKDKDKEKKKDRIGYHDSGAELLSGWRTWRNMARPFGCSASST